MKEPELLDAIRSMAESMGIEIPESTLPETWNAYLELDLDVRAVLREKHPTLLKELERRHYAALNAGAQPFNRR
jgi:hypothetical protein